MIRRVGAALLRIIATAAAAVALVSGALAFGADYLAFTLIDRR